MAMFNSYVKLPESSYGKLMTNDGFNGKIICKWAVFHSDVT